ncbi:hypothetical protein H5410_040522 [Solanum commersonii]|uniref:Rad51-like C-terminal domain-containing protein n=1 Tax=Solanum commersonii TaxID=4109 RepID=A0A9J5XS83_SOLCO|nr:hypothetical protein H5410_040522 [Solanum commersonii]
MKMAEFKSEKLLQLVGCEEGWFESSDKLISHGINVGDVKKFQEAGIYTCSGLMMHIKKREAVVGNTAGSESLDDVLGGGKKDTSAITKPFGEVRSGKTQLPDTLCVSTQDLTRSSIDLSDLLHLPTSYRDYMMKAEAGDGFFLSPPLIRWENIKKFFVDRIPPSWTPNLLLVHPNRNTCQLFDPEQYKALANIKQKTIAELRESTTCEEMFEELKELKELTLDDYQELATYEIEHDLRGFKLIGSFPNGWLILVNYAKQSFHLYEMSGSKWQTLMVYPGLTPNKNFIRVCDGVEIILLLEMSEGETVIHIFQIQGFDIVVHHEKFQTELKGKIKNAFLCGKVIPRTTDLTIKALELQETWFTSMVLSPVNTSLLIVFPPEMQFTVFEVYGEGVNLDMQKMTYIHLLNLQLYLAPNGGECALQEGHTVCLSTHVGADCLRGTTELHHDYEEDDYESDGEPPDEADEKAPDEADEEAFDEADEEAPDEVDEEAPDEADEEVPDEADEKAPAEADEEAPDEADEKAPDEADEAASDEADEEAPDEADEKVPDEADEDLPDQAADEMEDDDYFTISQRIRECPWDSQWEVCPCQPVWVMLPLIDMKKFLAVPSYIG